MMNQSETKWITPTLASNFHQAISTILDRMNQGAIYETWIAVKTLHAILPPDIYINEEIEKGYTEIERYLHGGTATTFQDQRVEAQRTLVYLANHIQPFFRMMYKALYDGGYLQINPKNVPIGHE